MKHFYCLLIMLCPYLSFSQMWPANYTVIDDISPIQPLEVGDMMPNIKLENQLKNTAMKSRISSYRGKLLILHFMSTNCSGCIASIEKYKPMVRAMNESVEVILVSKEPKERFIQFLHKRPGIFEGFPIIVNDQILNSYFPHESLSHIGWISKEGKVVAITGSQYITEKNIRRINSGDAPAWPVKKDKVKFNIKAGLLGLKEQNIPYFSQPALSNYSFFSGYMPDIPAGFRINRDSTNDDIRITLVNQSIPELFQRLYITGRLFPNQVFIIAPDQGYYKYNSTVFFKAGWDLENRYCFEFSKTGFGLCGDPVADAIKELSKFTWTEGRYIDTVVTGYSIRYSAPGTKPLIRKRDEQHPYPLSGIIYNLNQVAGSVPVIDARDIKENLYFHFSSKLAEDMPAFKKALREYGFDLETGPVSIRALVLKQLPGFPFTHSHQNYLK